MEKEEGAWEGGWVGVPCGEVEEEEAREDWEDGKHRKPKRNRA